MSLGFRLPEQEKAPLESLVSGLKERDTNQPLPFVETADRLGPLLLPGLCRALQLLRSPRIDSILLEGLPELEDEAGARAQALLIACLLGSPFQYRQQHHGEIVARVGPDWHTDDSFLDEEFRADFFVLAGHRRSGNPELPPGSALVLKNNRVLHARGQIAGERTVFRVSVRRSLDRLREVSGSTGFVFDLNQVLKEMRFPY